MKIILEKETQEVIEISKINPKTHIIVGIMYNDPFIMTRPDYETGKYEFRVMNHEFTNGNGTGGRNDFQELISIHLNRGKIEAFHQDNWKGALQWLIDNCD